jgi:hypothetical protein
MHRIQDRSGYGHYVSGQCPFKRIYTDSYRLNFHALPEVTIKPPVVVTSDAPGEANQARHPTAAITVSVDRV